MKDLTTMEGIEVAVSDHVLTITIDRPDRHNALTPDHFSHLAKIYLAAEEDDDVRVVIVTATGEAAFCAGADLTEVDLSPTGGQIPAFLPNRNVFVPIVELTKPSIAAVNGVAAGGGLGLALCADIRICSSNARFATAFSRIALTANDAVAWALPRIVGTSKALELIYLATPVDAAEALKIGLASTVVPADKLEGHTADLSSRLAAAPPVGVRFSKRMVIEGMHRSYREHVMAQEYASLANRAMANNDINEGVSAFREKRPPEFKGSDLVRRWENY